MFQEIVDNYYRFSDALIRSFTCRFVDAGYGDGNQKIIEIMLSCWNQQVERWQMVKIIFIDYSSLRFVETRQIQSHAIFQALLKQTGDDILFDFFPILIDGRDKMEEDPNSDFSIHCKEVKYEVIDFDITASKQK